MRSSAGDHSGRHGPRGLHHNIIIPKNKEREMVREREEGRKGKGRKEKRKFQRRGASKLSFSGGREDGAEPQSCHASVHVTCVVQNNSNKFRVCWVPRTMKKCLQMKTTSTKTFKLCHRTFKQMTQLSGPGFPYIQNRDVVVSTLQDNSEKK